MPRRGPDQDNMPLGGTPDPDRAANRPWPLGEEEEEALDLGFIVEDHDDRRAVITSGWQRLDELDTDEPLETNRSGPIPEAADLAASGLPPEAFATDYHVSHAESEAAEEEFYRTSMLDTDPADEGPESQGAGGADAIVADLYGQFSGVTWDSGSGDPRREAPDGFQIRVNPGAGRRRVRPPRGGATGPPGEGAGEGLSDEERAERAARAMERRKGAE